MGAANITVGLRLVRRLVRALHAQGWQLRLLDEEGYQLTPWGASEPTLIAALGSCDSEVLECRRADDPTRACVLVLIGEGSDCLADWSESLNAICEPLIA